MNFVKDELALDRTRLANTRTLLSFVRTSFFFVGLGLTIIGIESFQTLKFLAAPLFIIAFIIMTLGAIAYFKQKKKIETLAHQLHKTASTPL